MRRDRLRIVIAGMVAGVPGHGGATWAVLQWVLGLRALGHDVLLVEPVDELTPARRAALDAVAAGSSLAGQVALVDPSHHGAGVDFGSVAAWCDGADVLLNIAGMLRDPELVGPIPHRAYLDLDPVFTQLWHHHGLDVGLAGHTAHLSVGLELGGPRCDVPTGGVEWAPMLPPVFLPAWPAAASPPRYGLTTVANWRSYGTIEHEGTRYGQKAHSWRGLLDLPASTALTCEPALAIHPDERDDVAALDRSGWRRHDPSVVARTNRA